jgi:hypothetical protein
VAKRRRRNRLQQLKADVLGMVSSARNLSRAALLQQRQEISATRSRLENLVGEERSFKLRDGRPWQATSGQQVTEGWPIGGQRSQGAKSETSP